MQLSATDRNKSTSRIRGKSTQPALIAHRLLRELGFTGYRLHRTDLPGKPDIAFVGRKLAVMIHGCFWHGHSCKEGSRRPKSNQDYWLPKIARNQHRDALVMAELTARGWGVLIIWECELRDRVALAEKLGEFMRSGKAITLSVPGFESQRGILIKTGSLGSMAEFLDSTMTLRQRTREGWPLWLPTGLSHTGPKG